MKQLLAEKVNLPVLDKALQNIWCHITWVRSEDITIKSDLLHDSCCINVFDPGLIHHL